MKLRTTLRTFCRWMLTVLTVVLVVVWIGSGWYSLSFSPSWTSSGISHAAAFDLGRGNYYILSLQGNSHRIVTSPILWTFQKEPEYNMGFWDWQYADQNGATVAACPAWFPILLTAIPTALMWRTHIIARRRRPGTCTKCGYDITGVAGAENCPECGTAFEVVKSQAGAS